MQLCFVSPMQLCFADYVVFVVFVVFVVVVIVILLFFHFMRFRAFTRLGTWRQAAGEGMCLNMDDFQSCVYKMGLLSMILLCPTNWETGLQVLSTIGSAHAAKIEERLFANASSSFMRSNGERDSMRSNEACPTKSPSNVLTASFYPVMIVYALFFINERNTI